jgi:hypothetical protein
LTLSVVSLWSLGPSAAAGAIDNLQLDRALARFNAPAPPAYRAYRRLEAGIPGSNKYGRLEAWTVYQPGQGLSYDVVLESGYEYVRNRVLRGVLNSEQKLMAHGRPLRAPLVAANYDFEPGGTTESGLMRLLLHPARKSHGIVNGCALIDPGSGGVERIEGRLVKSPSFWVRDVDVIWKFAPYGNAVVPIEISSSARVRFFGRSSFKMTYDYESIDGRAVGGASRASLRHVR